MAKTGNKDPRRVKKNERFKKLHPGMTRTDWAKAKREARNKK